MSGYIELEKLEVYQLARELSRRAWAIYKAMRWSDRRIMGDQFIESVDSVGANIAEGYKRYHYLDKVKFYYNGRASLSESSSHWLDLLVERGKIGIKEVEGIRKISKDLEVKLNRLIKITVDSANRK
jgi:four helix bundle protein